MKRDVVLVAYTLCTTALFVSVLAQPLPPCVDYPQHLALAGQMRDLLLGQGEGRLVLWTYNGLFHWSAALLALFIPLEIAGRLVLAGALALTPLTVWRLVRFARRPPAYAFACFPFAYSMCFSWGFVNFILSTSLATLALIAWLERRSALTFLVLSILTGLAHVLGVVVLVAGVGLGALLRAREPRALAQLGPVLLFAVVSHVATDPPPRLPWTNQVFYPPWGQRLRLADALLGSWQGPADEWLVAATGVVLALSLLFAAARSSPRQWLRSREPFSWLMLGALATYALGPLAVLGCWFFFQRAGYVVVLWLPAVVPVIAPRRWAVGQAAVLTALGVAATGNFVVHGLRDLEVEDARAIIDAIPAGAQVAPVIDTRRGREVLQGGAVSDALVWGHFPAYAVARRGAEILWMFAREHGHFPLRQTSARDLTLPPVDYGWSLAFDPQADYARVFRHILVRAASSDPKEVIFGGSSKDVTTLAHHGRFWLYEYTPPGE